MDRIPEDTQEVVTYCKATKKQLRKFVSLDSKITLTDEAKKKRVFQTYKEI